MMPVASGEAWRSIAASTGSVPFFTLRSLIVTTHLVAILYSAFLLCFDDQSTLHSPLVATA